MSDVAGRLKICMCRVFANVVYLFEICHLKTKYEQSNTYITAFKIFEVFLVEFCNGYTSYLLTEGKNCPYLKVNIATTA